MADAPVKPGTHPIESATGHGSNDVPQDGVAAHATTPPGLDGTGARSSSQAGERGWHFLQPRWRTRRIVFLIVAAIVVIFVLAAVRYYRLNAGLVKTDNAQTSGDLAP